MNDFSPLQIAYRQIANTRPEFAAPLLIAAYTDLMNSCEYERADIVETLERAGKRAGLTGRELRGIWERVGEGDEVVALAELLNPVIL